MARSGEEGAAGCLSGKTCLFRETAVGEESGQETGRRAPRAETPHLVWPQLAWVPGLSLATLCSLDKKVEWPHFQPKSLQNGCNRETPHLPRPNLFSEPPCR